MVSVSIRRLSGAVLNNSSYSRFVCENGGNRIEPQMNDYADRGAV